MEFVLEPSPPDPASVLATVRAKFTVVDDGQRKVQRSWFDTFDWRLHRAGLVLEQLDKGRLTLSRTDGEVLVRVTYGLETPCLVDDLPPGPLREQLAPLLGIRALLPVAKTVGTVSDFRVLNAEEKTVVRIALDGSGLAAPAPKELAPRLSVRPLRGYQAQADKVVRVLDRVDEITVQAGARLASLLAGTGSEPGRYTGKVSTRLDRAEPATLAVARILLELLDTAEANLPATIADWDTEFLHDLRIAVRRTRTALKLAGDVLPAGLAARYAPRFKWLGDITTPTRDLDVYVLGIDDLARGLAAAAPADLAPFRVYLERQRRTAQRRLARSLRSVRFGKLVQSWRDALTAVAVGDSVTAAELAADRIHRTHRRVVKRGSLIDASSPPEALHDLRKRCKELRYLLEFFASLHDPATHRGLVKDLKGLQDCLGEFQDGQVQADAIRTFAAEMMAAGQAPPATLLAMGELTARLEQGQHHAREEFAGRFARFASARNTDRVKALLSGSSS